MISRTVTAVLEAPQAEVFDFLSRVENLPTWATDFARELTYENGRPKVVNGLGEFYVAIEADAHTGVIDMYAGPDQEQMAIFPTRVVALSPSQSAYSFTMFKGADSDDDLFEAQTARCSASSTTSAPASARPSQAAPDDRRTRTLPHASGTALWTTRPAPTGIDRRPQPQRPPRR
jgi:hypothetical protein